MLYIIVCVKENAIFLLEQVEIIQDSRWQAASSSTQDILMAEAENPIGTEAIHANVHTVKDILIPLTYNMHY